jgi:CBS domain-containing protein
LQPRLTTRLLVREVMNSPVISVSPRQTAKSAARLMVKGRVGSVVVMSRGRPLGILTDGDLVAKVVAKGLDPSKIHASRVMSKPLHTISAESDIIEAARLMRKLNVKRLGVLNRGSLVGIISISDILSITPELMDVLSEKASIERGERTRTAGFVAGYCDSCDRWSDLLMEVDGQFMCEECRTEGGQAEESA